MVCARWLSISARVRRGLSRTTTTPGIVSFAPLLLGLALSGLLGCERTETRTASASGLNVILISMDTTRADHLACYGHPEIRTPSIDRLAAEGALFAQCTTAAPITLPAHTSMLTGTYPFVHKVRDNFSFQVHADNLTLAEVLRDAGYATAAQVGAFVLDHRFGLGQGFAPYLDVAITPHGVPNRQAAIEITAEQVTDGAIGLLRRFASERFFLFVHYFDPHRSYKAPRRFAEQYSDPYTAEIAYTDEQIGRLLRAVTDAGVNDETLIVLTGDHGDGLGQHQETAHSHFVYDTTLTVPLIFWCPGRIAAGVRVEAQVRTIDIPSTILALLGLPPLPDAQGVDLSPLLFSKQSDLGLAAYAETFYPRYNFGFSQLRALRDGRWKYIHASPPELYDVTEDPQELNNLAPQQAKRVDEMRARLRALIEQSPRVVKPGQARRQATPEDVRRLESLGYVGAASGSDPGETEEELDLLAPVGPNPMEHTREIELARRAIELGRTQRHADVEEAFRALLEEAGERAESFVWAHVHLVRALVAQGKFGEALEYADLAVRAKPDDGETLAMKATVLQALGRDQEGLAALRRAVTLEPVFASTHLKLANLLAKMDASPEAIEQYRLAIEKEPLKVRPRAKLARLLAKRGQHAEALRAIDGALEAAKATGETEVIGELQTLRRQWSPDQAAPSSP